MKTLRISEETHTKLKEWGEMGDSFDDVVNKLIECCKEAHRNDKI